MIRNLTPILVVAALLALSATVSSCMPEIPGTCVWDPRQLLP